MNSECWINHSELQMIEIGPYLKKHVYLALIKGLFALPNEDPLYKPEILPLLTSTLSTTCTFGDLAMILKKFENH